MTMPPHRDLVRNRHIHLYPSIKAFFAQVRRSARKAYCIAARAEFGCLLGRARACSVPCLRRGSGARCNRACDRAGVEVRNMLTIIAMSELDEAATTRVARCAAASFTFFGACAGRALALHRRARRCGLDRLRRGASSSSPSYPSCFPSSAVPAAASSPIPSASSFSSSVGAMRRRLLRVTRASNGRRGGCEPSVEHGADVPDDDETPARGAAATTVPAVRSPPPAAPAWLVSAITTIGDMVTAAGACGA